MKLLLQKVNQGSGASVYAGRIRVGDLIGSYKIDHYDKANSPQGYQRLPDKKRCISFALFIKAQYDAGAPLVFPTSILASTRKKMHLTALADRITFSAELNSRDFLFIVDGQHRTEAFKYAVQNLGMGELEDFELPIVVIDGMKLEDEVNQFLAINTNMKTVKVDLANQLLINLGVKVPEKKKIAILATKIANHLQEGDYASPWMGKLRPANAASNPSAYWNTVLSFHNSLKPILGLDSLDGLGEKKIAEQLGAFWAAVAALMPEVFSASHSKYLVTKNNGFVSLHRVFAKIYKYLRYKQEIRHPSVKDYKKVLSLAKETVFDADFWLRTGDGAASFGGGFGGYSKLANAITEELANAGVDF
jgi:DGQHR domain-containing protein